MNISFVGKNPKSGIEPFNSPMVLAQPNSSPSEGFFFPMPTGEKNGDIAYWNPSAGSSGAWVKLDSPQGSNPDDLNVLSNQGNGLNWSSINLQEILNRLTLVENSVDSLESTVSSLESTVSSLESTVNSLESTVNSLASDVSEITSRLNSASINAECQNGTVTVTLNL